MRVAIVGSGPSGFYAAARLLAEPGVEVDLYERLPTPWGLVRGGVAPDHPKIKSVSRVYEKIARQPGFRFFGSVEVGTDVTQEELGSWYGAVLYAVGTAGDRRAGIQGEDLPGSWSAAEFVGWYNGHPDYRDLDFDLGGTRAVVVGNGNVAVDVARMLTLAEAELAVTDIADHAMHAIVASSIEEIVVLGRRGPEQAAFTTPELLELGELTDAEVVVDPRDLEIAEQVREAELEPTSKRNMEVLHEYSKRPASGKRKRVVLRFLSSPVEIVGDVEVEGVRVGRNELVRNSNGRLTARATGGEEFVEASVVFRAIGYTGVALPGVPFDESTGLIPNERGRIIGLPGAYVAGWIKRGPSGVIGTNKKCATETVTALLEDRAAGRLGLEQAAEASDVEAELLRRCPELVTYEGWEAIDAAEREAGEPQGRPRVKLTRIPDLLEAAGVRQTVAP